jgi:dienelactone hydrolase
MKKSYYLLISLLLISIIAKAQYPVGHQSLTYTDPARSNRSVTTEVYYPATLAGETTPFAAGQFPVIIFGHGFVMAYSAYAYFKDAMVPLGYIVVFATTETSMSPSHANFGADLAFLLTKIKSEASNSSSPFYNKLAATSAIMGHSMGGGSSFLACENNATPTCMVTFAAANTTPSSITAAQHVTIPALVLSGSVDCVAAPSSNQVPMYDSLASGCKVFVSINGGCHCYFADYNFNCILGEQTCDVSPPLPRANQEDVTLDFVKLYFDYYLKGNSLSWTTFNDSLNTSLRITHQISCTTTGINEINNSAISLWPNPSSNNLNIQFSSSGTYSVSVLDILGKNVLDVSSGNDMSKHTEAFNISALQDGLYIIQLELNGIRYYKKILKD